MQKIHNSKRFWSVCMKFSGIMYLGMKKNICRNFVAENLVRKNLSRCHFHDTSMMHICFNPSRKKTLCKTFLPV